MAQQPNEDPFKFSLSFKIYLIELRDELCGRRTVRKEEKRQLPDGSEGTEVTLVSEVDEDAHPLFNDAGANAVVHKLRMYMNQHTALGDLNRDEIAEITGNAIKSAFQPIFYWREKYGVTNVAELESEGLALWDSLYIFLTSLKEGGLRAFGTGILSINWVTKPREEAPAQGLYNAK